VEAVGTREQPNKVIDLAVGNPAVIGEHHCFAVNLAGAFVAVSLSKSLAEAQRNFAVSRSLAGHLPGH
jgi:hypothetical protein